MCAANANCPVSASYTGWLSWTSALAALPSWMKYMTASGAAAHVAANGATVVAFVKVPAHGADRQRSETRFVDGTHSSGTHASPERRKLEIRARYVPEMETTYMSRCGKVA